jgi:hypothetical protein
MSVTFGPETQAALDALKAGKDIEIGDDSAGDDVESSDDDNVVEEGTEVEAEAALASDDAEGVSETAVEEGSKDSAKDIEEIFVDDGKGRRKVQIDYTDKAAIKKYAEMAYGMRKFQRERDQLTEKVKALEPKAKELEDAWGALERAYEIQGVRGLVNLLVGKENAYEEHINQVLEESNLRQTGSEEEIARFEAKQEAERIRKENARMLQDLQKKQEEQRLAQENAVLSDLQNKMTAAYSKWSFEGKLGDAELEDQYNTALWELSRQRLKEVPETEDLTPAKINSVFQEVASRFNRAVTTQTKQKVAATVQKKKDAAATKAAAIAGAGHRQSAAVEEFKSHIRSGNLVDSLKMYMSGKVRLK